MDILVRLSSRLPLALSPFNIPLEQRGELEDYRSSFSSVFSFVFLPLHPREVELRGRKREREREMKERTMSAEYPRLYTRFFSRGTRQPCLLPLHVSFLLLPCRDSLTLEKNRFLSGSYRTNRVSQFSESVEVVPFPFF